MTAPHPRDHLDHLPGRTFLLGVGVVAALAVVGAVTQIASSETTGATVLWSLTIGVGALSLLALGVAWEERRSHVHALVREAIEDGGRPGAADPIAELLRMGAHREIDYLRTRLPAGGREELP